MTVYNPRNCGAHVNDLHSSEPDFLLRKPGPFSLGAA
jgi:hypothetical protein